MARSSPPIGRLEGLNNRTADVDNRAKSERVLGPFTKGVSTMASFASANLDHELIDKFVTFKLSTKLHFEPEEIGKKWLLQIEFWEKDPLKDDLLVPVPKSVRFGEVDAGIIRNFIEPSKGEVELSYDVEFPAHLVNTELGKEEYYSKLQLKPVGEGVDFAPSEVRTNITHVPV
jgi:hypothetical protein